MLVSWRRHVWNNKIEERTVLLGLESNLLAERASLINSQVQPILDLNQLVSEISDTSHSQLRLGKKGIKCKLLFWLVNIVIIFIVIFLI